MIEKQPSQLLEDLTSARSRRVIIIGFTLVLVVIGFIVFFGLSRLTKVHGTLEEIISHEQLAIEMISRMQQSSRERSVLLYSIASTKDPFERDELVLKHSRLGGQFVDARQKLLSLKLDQVEDGLIKDLASHVNTNQKLQLHVLDLLSYDRFSQAQAVLNKDAVPAQNKMLDSITTLLEYELKKSHASQELLDKQKVQTQLLMLVGGGVATIFVVLIANFVNRRMSKLLSGLTTSAHKLKEANSSLESMRLALDQHGIVSIADAQGAITYVNDKFCEISGYSREELIGHNHRIINSGVHPKLFFRGMWATISAGNVWQGEVCNRSKKGDFYWVASTIVPFLNDLDMPVQYISIRSDITAIKEAEQVLRRGKQELESLVSERTVELREREELLNSIAQAAQDAVIMIDSDGNVTLWNPAAERMFGYAAEEIIGHNLHSMLVPSRYLDAHHSAFSKFTQSGTGPLIGEITELDALKRDGSEFPIEISISGVKIKDSWHAVAIVRDITIRKLADEHLKQLASTDALTGAFNRRRFNEVLLSELARSKRYSTIFSLVIFDIDHFKKINDTFGHQVGDQVLFKLSLLISQNIRNTDIFARWGGEEFAILSAHCENECPTNFAEKLRKLIESCVFTDVGQVTCSFGVTEYRAGDDEESIVKRADNNLYRAKETGRNCVCYEDKSSKA